MNTITISGNLTREPEVRAIPNSQQSVIDFSIANNDEHRKQADGTYADVTSFFDVEFWTKQPQHWLNQLFKGTPVVVCGTLKQDRWEKDGKNYSRIKIKVDGYPIVGASRPQTGSVASQPPQAAIQQPQAEDDIPF